MKMFAVASMDLKASSKDSINLSLQVIALILQVRMMRVLANPMKDGILPKSHLDSA